MPASNRCSARDIRALVDPDRVHRRIYIDPDIFELEMARIWGRAWIYVGHESQVGGHSYIDAYQESCGNDPEIVEYEAAMRERYAPARAEETLARDFHHTVVYPCLSIHSTFQQLRVVKPQAVDRTRMDIGHFRLKGAPRAYHRRHVTVSNNVNTPATAIGADDYENWFRCHQGLRAAAQDWVSIHRDHGRDERRGDVVYSRMGTSETFQRNQYAARLDYMTASA